ncbi:MAG: hypothetical protein QW703_00565 [Candidatus Aenigmatarchaeota archaeon]
MPVIGLTIKSMSATRYGTATGEIKINSTPKVNDVKEVTVGTLNRKALSFEFEFVTKYEPDMAEMKIEGELLYLADKNEPILKQWKSKKTIPEKVSVEILNHLFRRCLLKMANFADDLQLPPPIQIPRVTIKKQQTPEGVG